MLTDKTEGKRPLGDLVVDGTITLKWVLRNKVRVCGLNSTGCG
jgi:hypothetical protein